MHLSKLKETLLESELTDTGVKQCSEIRRVANGPVLHALGILGCMCTFQNGGPSKNLCIIFTAFLRFPDSLDDE